MKEITGKDGIWDPVTKLSADVAISLQNKSTTEKLNESSFDEKSLDDARLEKKFVNWNIFRAKKLWWRVIRRGNIRIQSNRYCFFTKSVVILQHSFWCSDYGKSKEGWRTLYAILREKWWDHFSRSSGDWIALPRCSWSYRAFCSGLFSSKRGRKKSRQKWLLFYNAIRFISNQYIQSALNGTRNVYRSNSFSWYNSCYWF